MGILSGFIVILLLAVLLVPFMEVQRKGLISVAAVIILAMLSGIPAIRALAGHDLEYIFPGSLATGRIPIRIDALSGWFILVINFTFITGAIYGLQYMKAYRTQKASLTLHCISYVLAHAALISICAIQNSVIFLVAWEIMALSSFILVTFESKKNETLNAGINFLIQSHACIMLLTVGFIWVASKTNSYDFTAFTSFTRSNTQLTGLALFLCFLTGFAIKAGFVPFHTWLPYAHPAAPSHVSGVMSGVIIKIGIYGILRMLLLIKNDYVVIGYIILFLSIISGIYGVMLAIIQHNLKKLLAYHSIENIGIIGIGIGLGCIGIGKGNNLLTYLGFAGALLHTLNHSLFKSLLFYGAGNIYQSAHTVDIEKLGGLGKQMPHTSLLFLLASLAICGLPPFNGFVSEFLIYNGMFKGLQGFDKPMLSSFIFGIFALALIGGLAMLCFTKAFGTIFSGRPRHHFQQAPQEGHSWKLIPMYAVVLLILLIGLFPAIFIAAISKPLELFTHIQDLNNHPQIVKLSGSISMIGISAACFLLLTGLILLIRNRISNAAKQEPGITWGCGYAGNTQKMQYTASSFIRTYRKLAEPMLSIQKRKTELTGIFPQKGAQETRPYDKLEEWIIDYPLHQLKLFFNRFTFLQNGDIQFYILYGIAFITLVLLVPLAFDFLKGFINFLNTI
ncbi:proton-conducting transporter transmembrane domain-containing protein [Flavihumibacter profundi]|uniref:proton-conducting transporter transmembrane domain-containing protein n=1 Tax=Flavihumibacter profundi TaxID=2716883 RepID=UPI001CC51B0D|nr:proton-conducting transporter membrane subunit [Flavihumibacter profundi]MBZ5857094.1 hypothetical protein [Flavihumibacter profundi]